MFAGVGGNFIPVLLDSALTASPICKPLPGGIRVQNIPQGPRYFARFAGYITLGVTSGPRAIAEWLALGPRRASESTAVPAPKPAMPKVSRKTEAHIQHHRDGSLWVKGQTLDGLATGYWEWFRKNGVRMRSGFFERGEQTGEWTTYDQSGAVYKVTTMKPKAKAK